MSLKLKSDGKSVTGINIPKAEQHYGAKFVMDTCVKDSYGDWLGPVALFYQPFPHAVSGSHYFALRVGQSSRILGKDTVFIMNGQSAVDHIYTGLVLDGEVYHSRYRHDFRDVGPAFIDGGLDYTRLVGLSLPITQFKIVDGEAVFGEWAKGGEPAEEQSTFDMDAIFDQYDHANSGAFWK